jgi:hypothetical protein
VPSNSKIVGDHVCPAELIRYIYPIKQAACANRAGAKPGANYPIGISVGSA